MKYKVERDEPEIGRNAVICEDDALLQELPTLLALFILEMGDAFDHLTLYNDKSPCYLMVRAVVRGE